MRKIYSIMCDVEGGKYIYPKEIKELSTREQAEKYMIDNNLSDDEYFIWEDEVEF